MKQHTAKATTSPPAMLPAIAPTFSRVREVLPTSSRPGELELGGEVPEIDVLLPFALLVLVLAVLLFSSAISVLGESSERCIITEELGRRTCREHSQTTRASRCRAMRCCSQASCVRQEEVLCSRRRAGCSRSPLYPLGHDGMWRLGRRCRRDRTRDACRGIRGRRQHLRARSISKAKDLFRSLYVSRAEGESLNVPVNMNETLDGI